MDAYLEIESGTGLRYRLSAELGIWEPVALADRSQLTTQVEELALVRWWASREAVEGYGYVPDVLLAMASQAAALLGGEIVEDTRPPPPPLPPDALP